MVNEASLWANSSLKKKNSILNYDSNFEKTSGKKNRGKIVVKTVVNLLSGHETKDILVNFRILYETLPKDGSFFFTQTPSSRRPLQRIILFNS